MSSPVSLGQDRRVSRSRDSLRDFRRHFAGLREAAVGSLRVDQLAVEGDFEHPVLAPDQGGPDVELLGDFFRQTGGSGFVVSNDAIFDLQGWHDGFSIGS